MPPGASRRRDRHVTGTTSPLHKRMLVDWHDHGLDAADATRSRSGFDCRAFHLDRLGAKHLPVQDPGALTRPQSVSAATLRVSRVISSRSSCWPGGNTSAALNVVTSPDGRYRR